MKTLENATATSQDVLDELPIACIALDLEGRIMHANTCACTLFNASDEQLHSKPIWQFMTLEEVETSIETFLEAIKENKTPQKVRRTIFSSSGAFNTYEVYRSLIRNSAGQAIGMRLMLFDVTEQLIEHEHAVQAKSWMESVLSSIHEAVIVTDALGFIRDFNPAASFLTGYRPAQAVGRSIEKILPILKFVPVKGQQKNFRMGLDGPCRGLATVLNHERQEIQVDLCASPILDPEQGVTTGVVHLWRKA